MQAQDYTACVPFPAYKKLVENLTFSLNVRFDSDQILTNTEPIIIVSF